MNGNLYKITLYTAQYCKLSVCLRANTEFRVTAVYADTFL